LGRIASSSGGKWATRENNALCADNPLHKWVQIYPSLRQSNLSSLVVPAASYNLKSLSWTIIKGSVHCTERRWQLNSME